MEVKMGNDQDKTIETFLHAAHVLVAGAGLEQRRLVERSLYSIMPGAVIDWATTTENAVSLILQNMGDPYELVLCNYELEGSEDLRTQLDGAVQAFMFFNMETIH